MAKSVFAKKVFDNPVNEYGARVHEYMGNHKVAIDKIKWGFTDKGSECLAWEGKVVESDNTTLPADAVITGAMVVGPYKFSARYFEEDTRKFVAAVASSAEGEPVSPNALEPSDIIAACGFTTVPDHTQGQIAGADDQPFAGTQVAVTVAEKTRTNQAGETKTFTDISYGMPR